MPTDVNFSKYFGEELRQRKRGILTKQNFYTKYRFPMVDSNGAGINISNVVAEYSINSPVAIVSFREATWTDAEIYYDNATIIDADEGLVEFIIPVEVRSVPGVYDCELVIRDENDPSKFYAYNSFYVYNEPSHHTDKTYTLLRIEDIRLSLRDSDFIENELIENYDYDIAEISYAVTRAVQFWNETPPPVRTYTTSNFPFRHIWLEGTQLFLFEMIEEHYRRNYFPHSLGGITIDDKNKFRLYKDAWIDRFNRFKTDVMRQKIRINAEMASGTTTGYFTSYTFNY